jgi:ABC-2 type transport system permease protein
MTFWWLAWKDLLIIIRDKKALLTLIAMPLLLISILGAAFGDMMGGDEDVTIKKFNLGIVNLDKGQLGGILSDEVFKKELSDQIKVTYYQEKDLLEKINDRKLSIGIVIDEDFTETVTSGKEAKVKVYTVPDPGIKSIIVTTVIEQFAQMIPLEAMANGARPVQGEIQESSSSDELNQSLLQETTVNPDTETVGSFQYYAAAMGVMFLLMTAVQGVSTMILEKEQEVYKRLLLSNLTYLEYLLGKMLGLFIICLTQAFFIILGTKLLFGVDWGKSVAGIVIMTFAFVVSTCGLGVLAGSFFKTEKAFGVAGMLGTQIFAALGGSMVPIYVLPDTFVAAAKVLPNSLALQTYLDLMTGSSLLDIIPAISSAIALGVIFFVLGVFRLSSERRRKYA